MVQWGMRKTEAIQLLGGDEHSVAKAIGVTYQAVRKWPEVLSEKVSDRVQAALWRKAQASKGRRATDKPSRTSKVES